MPLQTVLSDSPYFDDFNAENNYYRILFQPENPIQVRELNQLQTILQHQIELFGDNIFKRGTIINGCDITFHSFFPYVKIKDADSIGTPVNVKAFENYYARNSSNVEAKIVTYAPGFEAQSPDLNTLYLRYINSGNNSNTFTFAADEPITIYDPDNIVEKINVINGSVGFQNTDVVVITSCIAVKNSTGGSGFANGFNIGDYITNGTANVQIVAVDTSNTEAVILRFKPLTTDLLNANTLQWTFAANDTILSDNTDPESGVIDSIVGSGASALVVTSAVGTVQSISMTNKGSGYDYLPYVTISSTSANASQTNLLSLSPQTFLQQVTVANTLTLPVGSGYGMTINQGVVYQKGLFIQVDSQLVVVEKYANTPDAKAVGFDTLESIITSDIDTELLDNATGTPNETAPGADRLRLIPVLTVQPLSVARANTDFLPIVEFSQGEPYKQNRQTQYSVIGEEISRRTFEESGNFVIDPFLINT